MSRCPECREAVVQIVRDDICGCDLQRAWRIFSPETAETLTRAVHFQRGEAVPCDRCNDAVAARLVVCAWGCFHPQCLFCSDQTDTEAAVDLLTGVHAPGRADTEAELLRRLARS